MPRPKQPGSLATRIRAEPDVPAVELAQKLQCRPGTIYKVRYDEIRRGTSGRSFGSPRAPRVSLLDSVRAKLEGGSSA